MDDEAFVTYCGLCCLDCHGHTQIVPDLARDLRKELRRVHYEKFARAISTLPFGSAFRNYQECYDALGLMMKFRCKKGCRNGGGPPFCQIRKCCQEKDLKGCWECDAHEKCEKLDFLNATHGDSHRKNLALLIKKGVGGFVRGKRHW
ncbi:MAG: DUF3795 domain-containing protein [Methanolinea sp.]|jgi:hypothetical protein|nr:DUF3795 domain-containing protein [Methanolinea sp.]